MKNWIIIIFALLLLVSCTKSDRTIYLSDEIKRNFYFKHGSYWIYRDSISGREDSCYITLSNLYYGTNGKTSTIREVLSINLMQNPIDTNIKDSIIGQIVFMESDFQIIHRKDFKYINAFFFQYPFKSDSQFIVQGKYNYVTKFIPTYFQGINTFNGVTIINYYPVVNPDNITSASYFINDDLGIIKMHLRYNDSLPLKNEIWELQRCHLIK